MNKITLLTLSFLLVFCLNSFAQKKSDRKQPDNKITIEERQQSATFADGLREYYSSDYHNAEQTLRSVINNNPKNDAAYFVLGKINYDNQNYNQALDYFSQATKLNKNNIWYVVELAKTYKSMGDFVSAAKHWEIICKEKDNNEYYLYELAECYLQMQQYLKVINVYNQMENLLGTNDILTQVKVNLWLEMNDVKNAAGEYDKLISQYPYEVSNFVHAGNIYLTNNMPEKALEYYKRAEKINATDPFLCLAYYNYFSTLKSNQAEQYIPILVDNKELTFEEKYKLIRKYVEKAFQSKQTDDIQLAQTLVDKLKNQYPDEKQIYNEYAVIQILKNNFLEARKYLEIVIDNGSVSLSTWSNYIKILNDLNDNKSLYKRSKDIAELFPTNALLLFEIGKSCNIEKDYTQAIEYLSQAATYAYENNLIGYIQLELGNAYWEKGEKEKAQRHWNNAEKRGVKVARKE